MMPRGYAGAPAMPQQLDRAASFLGEMTLTTGNPFCRRRAVRRTSLLI
jgi:hypothetical protein